MTSEHEPRARTWPEHRTLPAKAATSTHHNRQRCWKMEVQRVRAPTGQRSSRSGIQRVKASVDRCVEICPVKRFRHWGVALFPSSCTSCLFPVKLRHLLAPSGRYSRPLSKWWTDPKEGSIVSISRSMWRIRPVKQPEKWGSSCPDAAPADVKLSRQRQKTRDKEINLWKSREQLNIVREFTEHFKALCHNLWRKHVILPKYFYRLRMNTIC